MTKLDPHGAQTIAALGPYDELVDEREFQLALLHERTSRELAQRALSDVVEARDFAIEEAERWKVRAVRAFAALGALGALALVGLGYLLGH